MEYYTDNFQPIYWVSTFCECSRLEEGHIKRLRLTDEGTHGLRCRKMVIQSMMSIQYQAELKQVFNAAPFFISPERSPHQYCPNRRRRGDVRHNLDPCSLRRRGVEVKAGEILERGVVADAEEVGCLVCLVDAGNGEECYLVYLSVQ
jgi:hypothetical protein